MFRNTHKRSRRRKSRVTPQKNWGCAINSATSPLPSREEVGQFDFCIFARLAVFCRPRKIWISLEDALEPFKGRMPRGRQRSHPKRLQTELGIGPWSQHEGAVNFQLRSGCFWLSTLVKKRNNTILGIAWSILKLSDLPWEVPTAPIEFWGFHT